MNWNKSTLGIIRDIHYYKGSHITAIEVIIFGVQRRITKVGLIERAQSVDNPTCITLPAVKNNNALKKAWVKRWNRAP